MITDSEMMQKSAEGWYKREVLILHKLRVVDDRAVMEVFLEGKTFELRLHKQEAFTSRAEKRAAYAQGTVTAKARSLESSRALSGRWDWFGKIIEKIKCQAEVAGLII